MKRFYELLEKGKTQFHLVSECIDILSSEGFKMIDVDSLSELREDGRYMCSPYSSMLIAFVRNSDAVDLRIAAAHTDFPMLKLKPNPEIIKSGYAQINVEPYGGLIKESWFDRPLGIAGKVILRGSDAFHPSPVLFDSEKPVCIIPNLAPHFSKGKNYEPDMQKEMVPVLTHVSSYENGRLSEDFLLDYVSRKLSVDREDIIDYDLYLYITSSPVTLGLNDEYLSAARIDNISSVSAILEALYSADINKCCAACVFFDNEEIGSKSKQGADSILFKDILEQLVPNRSLLYHASCLSVDVAHGTHPNYQEKADITNNIFLGGGPVIKSSASQRYVTDSEAAAIIIELCKEKNIKYKRQANRSGIPGGQTLGPIMSSYLPVKAVDMGIPLLAMHSAAELMCKSDYLELKHLITEYFSYRLRPS